MKTVCKMFIIAIGLFLISTSAVATDYRHRGGLSISIGSQHNHVGHGYTTGKHHSKKYLNHLKNKSRYQYSYKPRSNYKHRRDNYYSGHKYWGYQQPNHFHNRYKRHAVKKACHPVTRVNTDKHGKYHGTAATMCYDMYGDAYIMSGRRYLKH